MTYVGLIYRNEDSDVVAPLIRAIRLGLRNGDQIFTANGQIERHFDVRVRGSDGGAVPASEVARLRATEWRSLAERMGLADRVRVETR